MIVQYIIVNHEVLCQMQAHDSIENTKTLKRVLTSQYLAVLASVDTGKPYSNLIAFAVSKDLKTIVFVTGRNTSKYRNIAANENVSLLIDSRTNQPSDFSTALALTVIGRAGEAADIEREKLLSLYISRHPQLSRFASGQSQAVIRIAVTDYIIASFSSVQVIHVADL